MLFVHLLKKVNGDHLPHQWIWNSRQRHSTTIGYLAPQKAYIWFLCQKSHLDKTFNFRAFKATVNTSWEKHKCFLRTNFQTLVSCISQHVPSLSKVLLLKTNVHDYQTTSSQTTLRSKRRSFLHFRSEKLYQLVSLLPAQKMGMLQSWSPEVFHIIYRS